MTTKQMTSEQLQAQINMVSRELRQTRNAVMDNLDSNMNDIDSALAEQLSKKIDKLKSKLISLQNKQQKKDSLSDMYLRVYA